MTLSVFVFASAVVDLFMAKNLIAFYNQIPTLFAAVLPSYLWLVATAGLPIWRRAYGDLLVGFGIWHLGQVISAAALGNGDYHAGLFDLPWTVSFVWVVASATRARAAAQAPIDRTADTSPHVAEWRLVRGGIIAALPAMMLLSIWNLGTLTLQPALPIVLRTKAGVAALMTTIVGLLFLIRLLTVLRRVQQAEDQRADSLRLLFTSNPHPAWLTDRDTGRILEVSDRACERYGYSRETFQRMRLTDLMATPEGAVSAPAPEGAVLHWTRTGCRLEVEIDAQSLTWGGRPSVLTTAIDLTERRAADLERQQLIEQLRQAQKMEAVGRLAGGVAHDFNNILTAIMGYAGLASTLAPEGSELASSVNEIQHGAERAAGLTGQLLAFSRKQMLQPEVIDLNAVVSGIRNLLRRLLGEQIAITVSTVDDLWRIKADRTQIGQVILNLGVNARDAMEQGGTLRIETVNLPAGQPRPAEVPAGDMVELRVSDSGAGMSPEVRERIFEPFFTTKGTRGTGLGLATVYGIVGQSGGAITCESEPGSGSSFRLFFPRTTEPLPLAPVAGHDRQTTAANESVLVVEDDPAVLALAVRVLTGGGYDVTTATPEEALAMAERERRVHLLVSDVVMPGIGGLELAARLRRRWPGLPVLFISGYAEPLVEGTGASALTDPVLAKPFTPRQFLHAVRDVLSRSPRRLPA